MIPLRVKKGREEDVRRGMPWIYASDIIASSELLHTESGELVTVENHRGERIGTGYYNAKSQIACRVLSLRNESIDEAFFKTRLEAALARREKLFREPYYRLAHSEADSLPGLLIDRFGDVLVVQVGTAGMERLQPLWLLALEELLQPKTIILRNDISARTLEGLKEEVLISPSPVRGEGERLKNDIRMSFFEPFRGGGKFVEESAPSRLAALGTLPPAGRGEYCVEVHENGCIYYADLLRGQKTGWFYDQRDNRAMMAAHAKNKTLLDVYSHSGGFGILAAKHGAQVTLVDSSKTALELAGKAAARNGVSCDIIQGDAFEMMERLRKEGKIFDIVLADPPAFVKSKKDIAAGLKGYEKVARLATALVKPKGLFFIASCSHHAGRSAFNKAVMDGVEKAGRHAALIKQTGAGADHPRHPMLPQNEYLKGALLQFED